MEVVNPKERCTPLSQYINLAIDYNETWKDEEQSSSAWPVYCFGKIT